VSYRVASSVLIALICAASERPAEADNFQLPCGKDFGVSVGTGTFIGDSDTSQGRIHFERTTPTFMTLEGRIFNACSFDPKSGRRYLRRRWLTALTITGMFGPESTSLGFSQPVLVQRDGAGDVIYQKDSDGNPVLDAEGNPVPATKNGLLRASVKAGIDWTGGLGAAASIYTGDHLVLMGFAQMAGTFGWNEARAETVTAHALELNLDVTDLVQQHAELSYKWYMVQTGLVVGFPVRPAPLAGLQFTPYIELGWIWFDAKIGMKLDDQVKHDLENLHVDTADLTKPRTISKSSPTVSVGADLAITDYLGLRFYGSFAHTQYTTAYVVQGSAVFRFDGSDIGKLKFW